jgi:hypothetical protein
MATESWDGMPDLVHIMNQEIPVSIEEAILEKVRSLPAAKKTEVLEYVSGLESAGRKPFKSPKGILADLNFTLTEEDLAEARREMWANFPHDDIA